MVIDFHFHISTRDQMAPSVRDFCDSFWKGRADWSAYLNSAQTLDDYLESEGVDLALGLTDESEAVSAMTSCDFAKERFGSAKRLMLCGTVNVNANPDLPGRVRELKAQGFRALKLYPTYQHFFPNDKKLYPMYEELQALNMPVMYHTGISVFAGSKLKFGDPMLLDDVAVDFPRLNILMCHGGRGTWYAEAAMLAGLHRNMYIELSGLPPKKLFTYYPDFLRIAKKCVFGTDWPGVPSIKKNADEIRALPLTNEVLDRILYKNAQKLLGLEG